MLAQKPSDDGKFRQDKAHCRALALKALDQRLHAANINKSTTPAPAVAPMVASINTGEDETTPNEAERQEAESG